MATVKANAYGHGAVEVSKALEQEGVRYLAVFTIDEGIELRDAGIKTDILYMQNLIQQEFKKLQSITLLSIFHHLMI